MRVRHPKIQGILLLQRRLLQPSGENQSLIPSNFTLLPSSSSPTGTDINGGFGTQSTKKSRTSLRISSSLLLEVHSMQVSSNSCPLIYNMFENDAFFEPKSSNSTILVRKTHRFRTCLTINHHFLPTIHFSNQIRRYLFEFDSKSTTRDLIY